MWWLSRDTLRSRWIGFVGAFLALLCAAALVGACGVLLETGLRGGIDPQRYAAAPLVVSADQQVHRTTVTHKKDKTKTKTKSKPVSQRAWLDTELADTVAAVPGVARVITDLSFPASVIGTSGESFGHAWDSAPLTPMRIVDGAPPAADDEVVLDAGSAARTGLDVGDRVTVTTGGSIGEYRLAGIAGTTGRFDAQSALYFTTARAQRLADRPGQAVALAVFPEDGTRLDVLSAAVGDALAGTPAVVTTGADRGPVEFLSADQARTRLVSMGGALAGTAVLVAILVVTGTFALLLQQRQRELALLRAVGATPRQIRRLVGGEALAVGLVAGVSGAPVGLGLSSALRSLFVHMGAVPAVLDPVVGPLPVIAAAVVTVTAARVAARVSVRRAARIRPTTALTDAVIGAGISRWRVVLGLSAVAGYAALLIVLSILDSEAAATPVTFLSVVPAAIAIALLGPILLRLVGRVCRLPLRLCGISGYLAGENGPVRSRRDASVATPLFLMVAMTGTVLLAPGAISAAADRQWQAGTDADFVVTADGPGVPAGATAALSKLDDVTVTAVATATVRVGLTNYPMQGVTPAAVGTAIDPGPVAGTLDGLSDTQVAVSTRAAADLDLSPGDPVTINLPDNAVVTLTVTGVYDRGLGFGDLTVTDTLLTAHTDSRSADRLLVSADPGRGPELRAVLADLPGVRITDGAAGPAGTGPSGPEINLVAMGLVVAFTLIATVNILVMSTAERSGEFALLRLAGATRRQVRRMVRAELLVVAGTALSAATVVAIATTVAFATGMTGSPAVTVPWAQYGAIVAGATVLVVAVVTGSARVALRSQPATTIGAGS